MDQLIKYSEEQFKQRLSITVKRLVKDKISVDQPTAFLLGGQAGSGKTSLQTIIDEKMNENIIIINNDEFKPLHPSYRKLAQKYGKEVTQLVTPFSSRMTEVLIDKLSKKQYNLVIEGTLRTVQTPQNTASLLKERGFKTKLYVIAVPKQLSYIGTLTRFEDMFKNNPHAARETPKRIHDEMVNNLPTSLDILWRNKVFDEIHLYTRAKEHIYSSLKTTKSPKTLLESKLHETTATKILDKYTEQLFFKMEQNGRFTENTKDSILQHLNEYIENGLILKHSVSSQLQDQENST